MTLFFNFQFIALDFQFNAQSQSRSPKVKQQLQQQSNQWSATARKFPTSTFEMTTAEIKAEEFDFAENLAMFEKRKKRN